MRYGTYPLIWMETKWIKEYSCWADFYIDDRHPSGHRFLIVRYGEGYSGPDDLPRVPPAGEGRGCRGVKECREFRTGIPGRMRHKDIYEDLICRRHRGYGAGTTSTGTTMPVFHPGSTGLGARLSGRYWTRPPSQNLSY